MQCNPTKSGASTHAPADASVQLAEAVRLLERGCAPIDVPHRGKNPNREGWQNERLTAGDLTERFNGTPKNLGILMGEPSGGLVDVDIDAPEALALKDRCLPPTRSRFGRAGKPNSHWLYKADPCPESVERFRDIGRKGITFVELRSTGGQTVFPTSTHPSGESVQWEEDGDATVIDGPSLRRAVRHLAGASLIAHHWPDKPGPHESGIRHDVSLALAGVLLRNGWSEDDARDFIVDVARTAGDEEARARGANVRTTASRLAEADKARREGREPTKRVTGWPTFVELLGRDVAERAAEWLEIGPEHSGAKLSLDGEDWQFPPPNGTNAREGPRATTDGTYGADNAHLNAQSDDDDDQDDGGLNALNALNAQHTGGFPTHCLPEPVRAYVEASARATGAPTGFVALPLLVFAGATIGNNHALAVKDGEWYHPALFGAVVAPPGRIKSPAINAARRPLDVLQAEAAERYKASVATFEADLRAWEAMPKKEQATINRPDKPTYRRHYTVDTTIEAVAVSVRDNPGIAIAPDELTAWIGGMDAYRAGKGADRQNYLRLWSGQPIDVNRKGQEPLYVPNPVVGLVGGIQPAVIKDLAKGERYDGLVDRILWEMSASRFRRWTDATVPHALEAALVGIFRLLRSTRGDRPVTLSDAAQRRFMRWIDENAGVCERTQGLLAGVYAKLDQQIAKICLILHCLTYPSAAGDLPVSDATMAAAIEIGEYYRCQANVVIQAFGGTVGSGAAGLPDRIHDFLRARRHEGDGWATRTEIRNHLGRHIASGDITAALARLLVRDLAEMRKVEGKGRPTEEWRFMRERDGTPMGEKRVKRVKVPPPPGSTPDDGVREKGAKRCALSPDEAPRPEHATESAPSCPSCRRTLGDGELPCMACKDDWQCRACRSRERRYRPHHGDYVCAGERCGVNVPRPRVSEVTA